MPKSSNRVSPSAQIAAGSSSAFYDDGAIAAAADTVFVLAWGTHWEGSGSGPLAPLSFVRGVVRYLDSLPLRRRFVLGAPICGRQRQRRFLMKRQQRMQDR